MSKGDGSTDASEKIVSHGNVSSFVFLTLVVFRLPRYFVTSLCCLYVLWKSLISHFFVRGNFVKYHHLEREGYKRRRSRFPRARRRSMIGMTTNGVRLVAIFGGVRVGGGLAGLQTPKASNAAVAGSGFQ